MQLDEVAEQPLDVVERARPPACRATWTICHGVSVAKSLRPQRPDARREPLDVRGARLGPRHQAQRLDFLQQDADRFFEVQQVQPAIASPVSALILPQDDRPGPADLLQVGHELVRRPHAQLAGHVHADAHRRRRVGDS